MSLFGHHMQQYRAVLHFFDVFQNRQQMVKVMPVNRPDIIKAHFLKQRAAGHKAARIFFHLPRLFLQAFGQMAAQIFQQAAERTIGFAR